MTINLKDKKNEALKTATQAMYAALNTEDETNKKKLLRTIQWL